MAGKPKSHHEDTKNSFLYPLEGYTKEFRANGNADRSSNTDDRYKVTGSDRVHVSQDEIFGQKSAQLTVLS
jgi:hypothetical protein